MSFSRVFGCALKLGPDRVPARVEWRDDQTEQERRAWGGMCGCLWICAPLPHVSHAGPVALARTRMHACSHLQPAINQPTQEVSAPTSMHMVVVTFLESKDVEPLVCSKDLDRCSCVVQMCRGKQHKYIHTLLRLRTHRKEFFLAFAQFGILMFVFLGGLWWPFFKRIGFRLDRVHTFLLTSEFVRGESSVVSALFECYNDCPNNHEFRRNLYYATWIV